MLKTTTTLFSLLLFISCQHTPGPDSPGKSYYPLEAGTYSEFRVEKTVYSENQPTKKTDSQVRRLLGEAMNTDGQLIYPIHFSTRNAANEWKTDSVSAAWTNVNQAFEQENGKPIAKMYFPLTEGLKWDGSTYNSSNVSESIARDVDRPLEINGKYYPKTVTIIRQDDSTLLSRNKYIEIYAENVGLVMRERLNLQYCHSGDCIGKGVIESGWKEVFILEKFGKQ
ncbi:hypothetical protein DYBT9623_02254 [Dyadobacter sp. CECT 9623]|uniref:Lipoprotein n=1 Tax=Dyadobacter linearis TaxID=2823330 RepID=A0ABM8UPY2_9BACT|nr:hypothetical protein [Dyadobacter sp. CECT 9623]CAG5069518.1 hypothetical protein DYBT9623_02254 [Dyadobacter sp. CECT 9623]